MGASHWNTFNFDYFKQVVFDASLATFQNLRETEGELAQRKNRVRTITPGAARGRIVGGNLTVLTAIVGSAYLPDFRDTILFIEDTNEAQYRIDRMLTQLSLAGILGRVAGVVFGQCTDCTNTDPSLGCFTLSEVLDQHLTPLGVPAFQGALFGHIDNQYSMPVGVRAEIDSTEGTIRILEPVVA